MPVQAIVSDTHAVVRKVAITFAEINATTSADTDVTVKGLIPGQVIAVNFDAALDTGFVLVQAPFVVSANTMRVTLRNTTAGALTQTALNAYVVTV